MLDLYWDEGISTYFDTIPHERKEKGRVLIIIDQIELQKTRLYMC